MRTSDSPTPDRREAAPAARPDVLTARSRMRTKYGSQAQIAQVADMLSDAETLLILAVVDGPPVTSHDNHGLLALTDERLIFVPRAPDLPVEALALPAVERLLWTSGAGAGTLTVMTDRCRPSFGRVANADGRDLSNAIVERHPHVHRVTPAPPG